MEKGVVPQQNEVGRKRWNLVDRERNIEQDMADSLKRLVIREPFDKITIKQITDGAGVIRVTFYNHFQDKYDLLGWIIRNEILDPMGILVQNGMYKEALTLIFSNIQKDSAFYQRAVKIEGQNSFREISERCIYEVLYELFSEYAGKQKKNPEHPWLTVEYLARYYAQSMNFIVLHWIESGMSIPPAEVAQIYEYVGTRSMWDVLQEI